MHLLEYDRHCSAVGLWPPAPTDDAALFLSNLSEKLWLEPIEEATASAKAPAALPMFTAIRALSWVTQATLRTQPLKQLHWRSQRNSAKPTAMRPAIRAARATKKAHLT